MSRLDTAIQDSRFNSAVAWVVVAALVVAAVASVVVGQPVWAVFVAGGLAVVLLPAAAHRDPSVMPPWELLVLVALPIGSQFLSLPDLLADLSVYLALLAVATLVVVELHVFSPVDMTPRFAVGLVVLVTMAGAGLWTIVQFASDVFLDTALIADKTSLMWDLVLATAVGVVAAPLVGVYLRWAESAEIREFVTGEGL